MCTLHNYELARLLSLSLFCSLLFIAYWLLSRCCIREILLWEFPHRV